MTQPRCQSPRAPKHERSGEAAASAFIIDDDVKLCEWATFHLDDAGHDVEYFNDAATGLNAVPDRTPDVVILDIDLPDMSGLDALDRIRRFTPELPVVMLTGTADVPILVKAMNRGAFDYLTKPVAEERLFPTVRNAIQQHRLHARSYVQSDRRIGRDPMCSIK